MSEIPTTAGPAPPAPVDPCVPALPARPGAPSARAVAKDGDAGDAGDAARDPAAATAVAAGVAPAVGADPFPRAIVDHVRLAAVPGLSPRLVARLVREFGSATAVFAVPATARARVPGVGAARAGLVAAAPSADEAVRDLERARAAGVRVLVSGAPGWPGGLDDLGDPPAVLWARGDLAAAIRPGAVRPVCPALADALGGRGVAIVGSRRASNYGIEQARRLAFDLASLGVTVVSGLARGIDAAAHRGALAARGATVGVLGGGLAKFYPPENVPLAREIVAGAGAVVSEFPLDMPPLPHHFPRRNRVLAAMAAAVVVIEAAEGSGSLVTADHALDLGREVLAVPGRIDQPNSKGVHRLLREGAAVCESAADVLAALGVEAVPEGTAPAGGGTDGAPGADGTDGARGDDRTGGTAPGSGSASAGSGGGAGRGRARRGESPGGGSPAERAVLGALAGDELDADALLAATGLPPDRGAVALAALELRGAVVLGADGRYAMAASRR